MSAQGPENAIISALERAAEWAHLNAFVSLADKIDSTELIEAAERPLGGLPIAVKDNINVKGFRCTAGTPSLADWRPKEDAPVIAALRAAGALIVGKTNMHELSAGITSNNQAFGPVRNPYNRLMIPGGSSGGSAAAVAAGVVTASLGADTAGSCRIPAALCGCVGFRPTWGRYPSRGVVPLSSLRDTVGIFAHDVQTVRTLDGIIAPGETAAVQFEWGSKLSGKRLGVPRPYFYDNLDPETGVAMTMALELMSAAGATLVETQVHDIEELTGTTSIPMILYEALRDISIYLAEHKVPVRPWDLVEKIAGPFERELFRASLWGNPVPAATYASIVGEGRPSLQIAFRECFRRDQLDALVMPTTPLPARPIGDDDTVELNGTRVGTLQIYLRNTDPSSIAGLPSISVPAALSPLGLPIGVSFEGLAGSDSELLGIGSAFEKLRAPIANPRKQ